MKLLLKMIFRPFLAVRQKTKCGYFDYLRTYELLKRNSTPWSEYLDYTLSMVHEGIWILSLLE